MGIISSVLNGLGNLVSGGTWQQSGQELKQQEFNASEAQKQRDWQQEMSNTAYQRQAQDMEKAGVNSAMAFSGGASGASSPGGASAHSSASSHSDFGSILNGVANVANSFNRDKDNSNNINLKQAVSMMASISKYLH